MVSCYTGYKGGLIMSATLTRPAITGPVKTTKVPSICRHCHKVSTLPPAYMKVLSAMAPGIKNPEPQLTVGAIAEMTKVKRPLAEYLVKAALRERVLELVPGISGARVYRRTWYGRQILGRWKTAGWRP